MRRSRSGPKNIEAIKVSKKHKGQNMNTVNKYLKFAKDAVIEPEGGIEGKIIDRISHIEEKDKNLLDEKFKDFFDKNNSKPYLMGEKLKDHPGSFTFAFIVILGIFAFIAYLLSTLLSGSKKTD